MPDEAASDRSASELPSFEALDRSTLQEQAYQRLRLAVMGGVFKPGTAITIRAAAEALGTSPMPVRAALQRLETEGALVARGSKRTLEIPALSAHDYEELRDIRIVLEGLAAERSALNVTKKELNEIEIACTRMQRAAERNDREAYVQANWAFHLGIYRASRMLLLVAMIESLWLRVGPYVRMMMPDAEIMIASMPNHWKALEALRRRDGEGVREALAADISSSAVHLFSALSPAKG